MRLVKCTLAVLIAFYSVLAICSCYAATLPNYFHIENYTPYQLNVEINGKWIPHPINGTNNSALPTVINVPWDSIMSMCKGVDSCQFETHVKIGSKASIILGKNTVLLATGDISPKYLSFFWFELVVNGPGSISIHELY